MLIDAKGWCTLTDFGITVKTSKRIPAAGTPAYMAPELWSGALERSDDRHLRRDRYVVGERDRQSLRSPEGYRQMRRQHKSAPVPIERFDQPLQGLIASGMAKNPADRPQSARSFVARP